MAIPCGVFDTVCSSYRITVEALQGFGVTVAVICLISCGMHLFLSKIRLIFLWEFAWLNCSVRFLSLPLLSDGDISLVFVLCWFIIWHAVRERERERSIDAVSQNTDYISPLTAIALSAKGINWPTSARLHNPIASTGSLLKHQWNLWVCVCVWHENKGISTQKQLDYLTWATRVQQSAPLNDWQTEHFSGCCGC